MRPLLLLLMCLVSVPSFAADRAPAWEGKGADGKTVRFDPANRSKPAILLFWATWCPYCEKLMPTLQTLYDAAGKNRLDVYAIDIKDDGDPVKTLKERKQTFTLIRDGDDIAMLYHVKGTPGLFLVDAHGDIVYHAETSDPTKVDAALRERLHLPAAK
ncbi:MAG TPA: TlpA disulfide reductase family protein [Rudaea sp.]|jgi:thiol-disulfide isomerase/thioredoxin|nr:TlpA disulfide reductase family protein [Rudaea sp.]